MGLSSGHTVDARYRERHGGRRWTGHQRASSAREPGVCDSVVVTVAPVYLGRGGVNVSPEGKDGEAAVRFRDAEWTVLGRDVVMAARPDLNG